MTGLPTRVVRKIARLMKPEPNHEQFQAWRKANGDRTHRLNYDLSEQSVVLDVGGYEGQWASDIFAMYGCRIHIFEPVHLYADAINQRFARNKRMSIHPFGLAAETQDATISVAHDGSSVYKMNDSTEQIRLVKASDFLEESAIEHIDLIKINIEGGEYELLEHLIDRDWIKRIDNIQVQFHTFAPNAEVRMQQIQAQLAKTHSLTYQYRFVWENWQRKR